MAPGDWLSLSGVLILGAMSPGPSLALVVRNTMRGGVRDGLVTSVAHGLGVGAYAFLVAIGLGLLVAQTPWLFDGIRWAGAAFLVYLGIGALRSRGGAFEPTQAPASLAPARDGFLMAFLNPKIIVYFLALFAQFVRPEAGAVERSAMAMLAFAIDAGWYIVVCLLLGTGAILGWLRQNAVWLDRLFGVVLIGLALAILW